MIVPLRRKLAGLLVELDGGKPLAALSEFLVEVDFLWDFPSFSQFFAIS